MATTDFETPQPGSFPSVPELPSDRPPTLGEMVIYSDYYRNLALRGLEAAANNSRKNGGIEIDSSSIAKQIEASHAETLTKLSRRQSASS